MTDPRPDWNPYFMALSELVRARSNCLTRKVGAVVCRGHTIVSTGYNGTPAGMVLPFLR